MPHVLTRMRWLPLLLAPLLTGCAGMLDNMQGPVQPQSTTGPCQVERFYLLSLRSVPTRMTVANTGAACSFLLINPALNATLNAALLTGPAQHGQASTELANGRRQGLVSYVPQPGYVGPDKFDITLQPNAIGVTVEVTVTGK